MKFRDEAEREAWSSGWDMASTAGLEPQLASIVADKKIEAMRERWPDDSAEVEAVIEAARAMLDDRKLITVAEDRVFLAIAALDAKRGK